MWHDVKQNSDEPCPCCGKTWLDLRLGKVTGSAKGIGCVMANLGKAFGDPAKNLAVNIATFELGGTPSADEYSNSHMERGHEEEPIARRLYEEQTFTDVYNGGFYDNGKTGCSPDGNISTYGLVEIKSHIAGFHYANIKRGGYDPKYKWQLVFNLKESKREWIDYVSFCSAFPPNKKLYVFRLFANDLKSEFQQIDDRLGQFFKLIDEIKSNILRAA